MDRKLYELDPHAAYIADLRTRDGEFCRRMLKAINRGDEHCPITVDTMPGTKRPIIGYTRPD
jgi:hypothetical protein